MDEFVEMIKTFQNSSVNNVSFQEKWIGIIIFMMGITFKKIYIGNCSFELKNGKKKNPQQLIPFLNRFEAHFHMIYSIIIKLAMSETK